MADYSYTREIVNNRYNINNINHTEGTGIPVTLSAQIIAEPTLPDIFSIKCDFGICIITTPSDLTAEQKTTLDNLVAYQKTDN